MVGKWHNTPTRDCVPSAPKHTWPTSRGFDTFYGFMEGEAHFFFPAQLMMGTQLVPIDEYPRDYYTTDDWTDRSIQYLKELRASSPTKPFLLYLAHNAVHAPLQAKPADLAQVPRPLRRGLDGGAPGAAADGRSRSAWCRRHAALRLRPARAAVGRDRSRPTARSWRATWRPTPRCSTASTRTSGRLVAFLRQIGELDNTIVVFASDNGGTDAGGPTGMFNNNRRYMGLAAPPIEDERASAPDLGSPRSASLYPDRLGRGVEHAVPLVQDLHRRRRAASVVHRVVAGAAPRRAARSARSSCT